MLTTEAFNALLKTLEEPPEHVKFVFATTAPSKVPATIISRCQRFDFRRISIETIMKALAAIGAKEKLKIDQEALFAISKAASGSLRDALSITDQLGGFTERNIKVDDVTTMLGIVETELLFGLADCLGKKDCSAALKIFDQIISQGKDMRQLARDIVEHFRNLMIIKIGGKSLGSLIDYPIATKEMLLTQAEKFTLREIIDAIEIFVESQETSRIMDSLRIPFEVAFAKLTYKDGKAIVTKESNAQQPLIKKDNQSTVKNTTKNPESQWPSPFDVLTNQKGHVDFSPHTSGAAEEALKKEDLSLGAPPNYGGAPREALNLAVVKEVWNVVTHTISRQKMSVATYLQEGSPYHVKDSKLTISFPQEATFHKESLEQKENLNLIEKVFSEKLNRRIKIEFKIVDDHQPQEHEPLIKKALETFQGEVVNKWHNDQSV